MKIEIHLTWSEQKGIEKYLQDVLGIENPSKKDIQDFVASMITGLLHSSSESVSDYIQQFEPNETDI